MNKKTSVNDLSQLDQSTVFPEDPTLPRVRCDEALPLGNGLLGALVWMDNDQLCISFNRGDLWDERRPAAESSELYNWQDMCRLIKEQKWDKLTELFRKSPDEPYPPLIPGGRLEIAWNQKDCRFDLNEKTAVAKVTTPAESLEIFVPSHEKAVCRWRLDADSIDCKLRMKLFEDGGDPQAPKLGYTQKNKKSGNSQFISAGAPDKRFAMTLAAGFRKVNGSLEGATVIACADTTGNAEKTAAEMLESALQTAYDTSKKLHTQAWRKFHKYCNIKFKDKTLSALWSQARYFFNCNARKASPPAGLPGVWGIDDGTFPICRGDYHHNLNTQFTYLVYPAANDLAGGREFLDFMAGLTEEHRQWARSFYGIDSGIVIPGQ